MKERKPLLNELKLLLDFLSLALVTICPVENLSVWLVATLVFSMQCRSEEDICCAFFVTLELFLRDADALFDD